MTNLERIRAMDVLQAAALFKKMRTDPLAEYMDWEAWLSSEDTTPFLIGCEGILYPEKGSKKAAAKGEPCRILSDTVIQDKPYRKILLEGRVYYVPQHRVREVKA